MRYDYDPSNPQIRRLTQIDGANQPRSRGQRHRCNSLYGLYWAQRALLPGPSAVRRRPRETRGPFVLHLDAVLRRVSGPSLFIHRTCVQSSQNQDTIRYKIDPFYPTRLDLAIGSQNRYPIKYCKNVYTFFKESQSIFEYPIFSSKKHEVLRL